MTTIGDNKQASVSLPHFFPKPTAAATKAQVDTAFIGDSHATSLFMNGRTTFLQRDRLGSYGFVRDGRGNAGVIEIDGDRIDRIVGYLFPDAANNNGFMYRDRSHCIHTVTADANPSYPGTGLF